MRVFSFSLLGSLAATILNVEAALLAPRPPYQLDSADEITYRNMLRDKPAGIARRSEGYQYDTTIASTSSEEPTTVSSEAPPAATSQEPAAAIVSDPPTPMSGELHHTECGPYSAKVNNIWVTIETTKYFYYINQPEVTKVVNVPTTIYQHVTSAVTNVVEKTIVETKFYTATITANGAVTTAVVPTTVSVPMTETITKTIVNSVYGSDVVKTEFHTVTAAGNGTVITKIVPTTVSVPTTEVVTKTIVSSVYGSDVVKTEFHTVTAAGNGTVITKIVPTTVGVPTTEAVTKTVTISSVYGSDVTKTQFHTATITANGTIITSVVPATEVVTETVTVTSAYGSDVTETRFHTATVTSNGTVVTMVVPTTVNVPTTEVVTRTVVVTSVYGSDVTETQLYTTTITADGTVMTMIVPTTVVQPTTLPGVYNTVVEQETDSVYFTTTVREYITSVPSPGTVTVTATATITAVTTVVEVYTNVDTSVLTNEITRTNEVTETNLITHSIGYTNTVFETHQVVTTILSTVFTSYPVTLTLTPNCQNGDLGCTTLTEVSWTTEFSTLTTTSLVPTRITQEITNIATEVQTRPVTITPPPVTVTRAETVTAPAVTVTQAQFVTAGGVTITQAQTIAGPPVTVTQPASTQLLTVVEDVTACPAPTDSPIKIPYDPDSSYTWGCPPGYICNPHKPDSCNFWGDIPDKDYTCEPQYCIPAPKLNRTICEDGPVPQNPGYFNMNPEVFGLSFDIFEEPEVLTKTVGTHIISYTRTDQYVSQATLSQWYPLTTPVAKRSTPLMVPPQIGGKRLIAVRGVISKREDTLPESCYVPCNLASLEAQNVGRVPEICEPDSAFNESYATCQFCIDSLEGTKSYDDGKAYVQSKLGSLLDYCSVDPAVSVVTRSSTSVAAEEVQASLVISSRSPVNTDTSAVAIVESTSTSRATATSTSILISSLEALSSSDGSFTEVPSSATSNADALFGSSADAVDGSTATDAAATNSQSVSDSLSGTLTSGDAGFFTATSPDSSASSSGSGTGNNASIISESEVDAPQTGSGTETPTETGTGGSSLPTTSDSSNATSTGSEISGVNESTSSLTTETVSSSSTVSGSPETAAASSLQPNSCGILEALLNKVDQLRELNVSQHVGLLQVKDDNPLMHNFELFINSNCHKVNEAMGISMGEVSSNGSVFSEDVLKIEICGPKEDYLTIIDVPGIFRVAGGLTTPGDFTLVRNIVTKYIKDKRTVILAVIPSNVDIATQEILSLAKEHDPKGERTLEILTNPDLVSEKSAQSAVCSLIEDFKHPLSLGYYVVRNRGADDHDPFTSSGTLVLRQFFNQSPWSKLPRHRIGISSLKHRLGKLLEELTSREFPALVHELKEELKTAKSALGSLSPKRNTPEEQKLLLGHIAKEFESLTNDALNATYNRRPDFKNA
ncbi:hypothetical protein Cpir12675_001012 [Ceratocystis pirilliformis]|uniref:Dynamin GTPase domain-containing protein n=1 Tax=Ceratocystis pirilliformis TaxID=259994 RepID=A0ABR3ZKI2_9PEZI